MKLLALFLTIVSVAAFAWSAPPTDDEPAWGAAKGGLASRLTLATKPPVLGGPIKLKLEVKNVGDGPASYDAQQAATNGSLLVKGADGAVAPYIGGSFQTMGKVTTLKPGEARTIYADLDLSAQYLVDRPGNYTIESRSRSGVPASNVLNVTVGNGKLGDFQKLFGSLHRAAPKGWRAANYHGSIVFLSTPTGLKADSTSVSLIFTKGGADPVKPQAGQPAAVDLGETSLGHAWLSAQDKTAEDRWPDYAKVIGEHVKAFKR